MLYFFIEITGEEKVPFLRIGEDEYGIINNFFRFKNSSLA